MFTLFPKGLKPEGGKLGVVAGTVISPLWEESLAEKVAYAMKCQGMETDRQGPGDTKPLNPAKPKAGELSQDFSDTWVTNTFRWTEFCHLQLEGSYLIC